MIPSIVDPESGSNGASTLTRGLLAILREPPLAAQADLLAPPIYSGARQTARQAASLVAGWMTGDPAKVEYTKSRKLRRALADALAHPPPALVILNGADMLWTSRLRPAGVPQILVAHNLEQDVFEAQIGRIPAARFLGRVLRRDLARLRRREDAVLRESSAVIFVSPDERKRTCERLGPLPSLVLPPVFDYAPRRRTRQPRSGSPLELGLLGNFAWWPNRQGFEWFVERVLPAVADHVRLHLFGVGSREVAGGRPAVIAHGRQTELGTIWDRCDLFINPVQSGSGVSIKTAETVYNGAPQLATSVAVRGLDLPSAAAVRVLDEPEDWIAWLRSSQARELAAERPSDRARLRYSVAENIAPVQNLIRSALDA